jgi:hypothetical protein
VANKKSRDIKGLFEPNPCFKGHFEGVPHLALFSRAIKPKLTASAFLISFSLKGPHSFTASVPGGWKEHSTVPAGAVRPKTNA